MTTQTVRYQHDDVPCEGILAVPDTGAPNATPGVLVIHDWSGVGPYVRMRAEQLATAGYIALAPDIYGVADPPRAPEDNRKLIGIFRADRGLMRARARAGLDELLRHPMVDPGKVAAIGYCFGGGVALELARSGAPLAGAVSFHGNLDTPDPDDAKRIGGKILVCHGAEDPHVPPEQVAAFEQEMRNARVDWQLNVYGLAVHAFTREEAGNDPSRGAAYNAEADRRSWQAMMAFFGEIFGRS